MLAVRVQCRGLEGEMFTHSCIDCIAIEVACTKVEETRWREEARKSQYVTSM